MTSDSTWRRQACPAILLSAVWLLAPASASAKCGGKSSFLEWFEYYPEHKTVLLAEVRVPSQLEHSGRADFNAVEFTVVDVLAGAPDLKGLRLRIPGSACVNVAPTWKEGELYIVGAEGVAAGSMEFPVCSEAGLLVIDGTAYDSGGSRVALVADLAARFASHRSQAVSWNRLQQAVQWGAYLSPLFWLAYLLRRRSDRRRCESLRRAGRMGLARASSEPGNLSCPTDR